MTLRTLALAALSTLPLLGCGEPVSGPPSDAGFEIAAKEQVKARLRDPDSAEFTNVRVVHRNGRTAICGYVNSRNGFGGMTGPQRFITGGTVGLEDDFGSAGMDQAWALMC